MKLLPLYCVLLLLASACHAQFVITGQGKMQPLTGDSQTFNFGFSYVRQEGSYRFNAGSQSLKVHTLPKKYSVVLILQDNKQVWIPDFSEQAVNSFDLELGDYKLKLYKDPTALKARGNFVFRLNEDTYYFNRGPAQINFLFAEDGITDVRVEGMFKPGK